MNPIDDFIFEVIVGYYQSLVPKGKVRLLSTSAKNERDALLLAWAKSSLVDDIVHSVRGGQSGFKVTQNAVSRVVFGQITGSIDARQTLLQQHLASNPSLFVVDELEPSKGSLHHQHVLAWVIKLSYEVLLNASGRDNRENEALKIASSLSENAKALGTPIVRGALRGRLGQKRPVESLIVSSQKVKSGLHSKAGDALHWFEGLERLSPFAVKRMTHESVISMLSGARRFELAAALAMSEGLSISSGHALGWNVDVLTDGVIAFIGPYQVQWDGSPLNQTDHNLMVKAIDTHKVLSFIRPVKGNLPEDENETIRGATEELVALCRQEALSTSNAKETPLEDCAVILEKLLFYGVKNHTAQSLVITDFEGLKTGDLLRVCHRIHQRNSLPSGTAVGV
jgi:hypothetical protein